MGNILNLVYDNWVDDLPQPNLISINDKLGYDAIVHIEFLQDTDKFSVNKCKLEDVNDSENFYYIICHRCSFDEIYTNTNWEISEQIEYYIQNKNLKVIFLSEHESYLFVREHISNLINILKLKGLNENQFYIINNNSKLNDYQLELQTNIHLFKINYLLELLSKATNIHKYINPANEVQINYDKKFLFLCHNRRPKNHRLAILTLLKNAGLFTNDIIDWSLTYGNLDESVFITYRKQRYIDGSNNSKLLTDYKEICSKRKLSYFEENVDWFNDPNNYQAWEHIQIKSYENAYINIVTESHYELEEIHITEKTFKPFFFFQMPIFVSTHMHVHHLRKEHDLFLFDDLIDHSYDNEIDDEKRLIMVFNEIKRLAEMPDIIHEYYKSHTSEIMHNYKYIRDYYETQSVNNTFFNLI